jgi:UDP-N-acetylglucosamine transferase subunit ALG13
MAPPAATPEVVVFLGTDHHPFDRLVGWIAILAGLSSCSWFVQHGRTALPPGLAGAAMLDTSEVQERMQRAAVVVTHGGPGLIMEARALGHRPVVVARDPGLGEHVDDHQQRFVRRIAASGMIATAATQHELRTAVDSCVLTGRLAPDGGGHGVAAAARLGLLVDQLVRRT